MTSETQAWLRNGVAVLVTLAGMAGGGLYALGKFEGTVKVQIDGLRSELQSQYRELDGRLDLLERRF